VTHAVEVLTVKPRLVGQSNEKSCFDRWFGDETEEGFRMRVEDVRDEGAWVREELGFRDEHACKRAKTKARQRVSPKISERTSEGSPAKVTGPSSDATGMRELTEMDPPRNGLQDLDVSRRRTSVVSIVSDHGLGDGWHDLLDVELLDLIVDVDGVFVEERRVGKRTEDGKREGRGEGVFVGGGVPTSFGCEVG